MMDFQSPPRGSSGTFILSLVGRNITISQLSAYVTEKGGGGGGGGGKEEAHIPAAFAFAFSAADV
jgi:hypothetical protein